LFNPAQLTVSIFLAYSFLTHTNVIEILSTKSGFFTGILTYSLFLALFFIVNNLIVDFVLLIRPQPYPFTVFKTKTITELGSAFISLLYGFVMVYLEGRKVDEFSLFFFFSPLVAVSLLYSVISTLENEKKRL